MTLFHIPVISFFLICMNYTFLRFEYCNILLHICSNQINYKQPVHDATTDVIRSDKLLVAFFRRTIFSLQQFLERLYPEVNKYLLITILQF